MSPLNSHSTLKTSQALLRVIVVCLLSVCLLNTSAEFATAQESSVKEDALQSFDSGLDEVSYAAIEAAEYQATFSIEDLVDGEFSWKLLHRGLNSAVIDISKANLALNDLRSAQKRIIWGTTHQNRRVVIADSQTSSMTGTWSRHGRRYPGRTIFDCDFPPALSTKLVIFTPSEVFIHASVGHVSSTLQSEQPEFRKWTIELGRHRSVSISMTQENIPKEVVQPKVDVESVFVARQDGFFVQADFSIEGLNTDRKTEIQIRTSNSLIVQSVTSNGVPLTFVQDSKSRKNIRLSLPETIPRSRVNLRVQGFQPARWVRKHSLPSLQLLGAIETKRVASLRVEAPLELHSVERHGFFQSALTKEPRGEIWKFEAFQEMPKLIVDLGQPRYSLKAEIHSLYYLDTPLPWVATKMTTSVKSGRLFGLTINVPENWTVVSVLSLNTESEVSSWSVNENTLEISFKEPITTDSVKSIEILARAERTAFQTEQTLPTLLLRDAVSTSIQTDWVLSPGEEIDLSSLSRWKPLTSKIDFKQFKGLPQRVQISPGQSRRSFFNSKVNLESLPKSRIFSTSDFEESRLEADEVILEQSVEGTVRIEQFAKPANDLHLLTHAESLDDQASPRLVHHATLEFLGSVSPRSLGLKLSEDCLLSSVAVDGQAVTVFREENRIVFPEEIQEISQLTLIYITDIQRHFLREGCRIPLPQTDLDLRSFDWTLEVPAERKLTNIEIPGIHLPVPADYFFFGPLSANWRLFSTNELRHENTNELSNFSNQTLSHNGTTQFKFYSLHAGAEIHFEVWNVLSAFNLGWVAFLACMIVGVGGRLIESTLIRRLSLYWLFFLLVLQFMMVNEYSMIGGAMLAGTLISILLPVELMRLPETQTSRRSEPKLATATVLICFFFHHSLPAQSPAIASGSSAPSEKIPYLLRSVKYEVINRGPSVTYRAKLEVLTRSTSEETLVELPYQGVVFQSGAECLVDGQVQTLIPAVSGTGVVVRVPKRSAANQILDTVVLDTEAADDSDWASHLIQFEFVLRDQTEVALEELKPIQFPAIFDSVLTLDQDDISTPQSASPLFERNGQNKQRPDGRFEITLGPINSLVKTRQASHDPNTRSHFYTLLNVSTARIAGQLFIPQENFAALQHFTLNLADHTLVTNVTGQGISQWFVSIDSNALQSLVIEFKPEAIDKMVVVSFYLPSTINTNDEIVIPRLNWSSRMDEQLVGVKVANGIELGLVPGQVAIEERDSETWPQNDLLGRTRPNRVFRLDDEQSLRLTLQEITPTIKHTVAETLTVDRTSLLWEADIEIEAVNLPIFVHKFTLSGGLRINSVRTTEAGKNSLLRFYQSGSTLSIFIPGGQLGVRKLHLNGDVPFTSETLRTIPKIEAVQSELQIGTLTILDHTNWDIEFSLPGGTKLKQDSLKTDEFNGVRSIGQYSTNTASRPTQIRLLPPPAATRVDIATRVQINDNQSWNCVQLLHFSGDETPLKKVTLMIPKVLESVRIGPRYFSNESIDRGDEIEFIIPIPERFSAGVTIQVYSKLPKSVIEKLIHNPDPDVNTEVPGVRITSARTVSQFLFFNENRFVTTPALEALPVERKNLPEWIPLQWREAVTNLRLDSYQMIEGNPQLVPHQIQHSADVPLLRFAETAAWSAQDGKVMGMTRLWLSGSQRFSYLLPFRKTIKINRAYQISARELLLIQSGKGISVEVDSTEAAVPVVVYWETNAVDTQVLTSPLEPTTTQGITHLLGIVGAQSERPVAPHKAKKELIDALIARWEALLNIAESTQVPIAVESPLYLDLRESHALINEMLNQQVLSEEQRGVIRDFNQDWSGISEKLTISAGPVLSELTDHNTSIGLLLGPQNQFQSINWVLSDPHEAVLVEVNENSSVRSWLTIALKVIVIFGLILFVTYFNQPLQQFVNPTEQNPVLRLLILGCLWLFCFKPILIGFVLIALALTLHLSRATDITNDVGAAT